MENYVCEKCKREIQTPDLVFCSSCKKAYHKWCWIHTEGCVSCGKESQVKPVSIESFSNQSIELSSNNDGMFSNIGEKLKGVAKFLTATGIIEGIIIFILMSMSTSDEGLILVGLLIGVAVAFISWISSFVLFGFGALISSSQNTERFLSDLLKEIKK